MSMVSLTNQRSGARVHAYRNTPDVDVGALPWVSECETHSTLMGHATRKLATQALSCPDDWCDGCRAAFEARQAAKAIKARPSQRALKAALLVLEADARALGAERDCRESLERARQLVKVAAWLRGICYPR